MTYQWILFLRKIVLFGMCLLNYVFLNIIFISFHNKFQVYGQHLDPLQTEKCRLKCNIPDRSPEIKCLRACMSTDVKPGKCPIETNGTMSQTEKSCVNLCKTDPQCPRIKKCCRHECGTVCMTPTELDTAEGLPPIPTHVTIHVNETDIAAEGVPIHLRWYVAHNRHNKHLVYVVEEKHCYDENEIENMNETSWNVVRRTPRRYATVRHLFKPGLYYQFRVYSVNTNGSVGPSKATKPYQILPNITQLTPEAPMEFGVGTQSWGNGTLRYLLVWQKPPTLIPIYRYKISWSTLSNETLFQNSKYLSGNLDHYWLSDVMPMTEYFLELYAIVKIDVKKIPGKSTRIVVRTQEHPPPKKRRKVMPDELNLLYKDTINSIRVTKLYWIHENLYAIVDWKPIEENVATNYSVTWAPSEACRNYEAWYVARAIEPQFEIYDLVPGCDYNISIKAIHNQTLYTGNSLLPIVKCYKKLDKQEKKEYTFAGAEIPIHPEFKPLRIVDCPLPEIYRPGD